MLCLQCSNLSISRLVELARVELSAHSFPQKSFYTHHGSFPALVVSANNGCGFCQYIYQGLKDPPSQSTESYRERQSEIEAVEAEGGPTDIKIAINTKHLYSTSTSCQAKDVELFDTLMVQVGLIDNFELREDGEKEPIPTLEFVIHTPEEEPLVLDEFKVGRLITDPNLASRSNMHLALNWMQQCEKHERCPSSQAPQLPTRVIDVGVQEGHGDMKLFVTGSIKCNYIALSHCWGGLITPLLKKETLVPWQKSMNYSELPANFRDAILITQRLGLRYVWIDALCIIQDSAEDWNVESKKMGSLYHDALVTVAAATSIKSTEGFLKCVPPHQGQEDMFNIKLSSDPQNTKTVKLAFQIPEVDDETLRGLFGSAPLHTRGWCLQETIISPRILHFGTKMIYWHCLSGFKAADGVPPSNRLPEESLYRNFDAIVHRPRQDLANPPDLEEARNEFYNLISDYSARNLTYGTDKFPAFSGIARLMQPAFEGGTYVAGLWTTDLRGLLWYEGFCPHVVSPYRAPSWSWAVTDHIVLFVPAYPKLSSGTYGAKLISFEQIPSKEDPFGEVSSAHLVLHAKTKKFVRSKQNIGNAWPEGEVGFVRFDDVWVAEEGSRCHVFELAPREDESVGSLLSIINGQGNEQKEWDVDESMFSEKEYLAVLIQAHLMSYGETKADEGSAMAGIGSALVVEKVNRDGEDDAYVRVGFFELTGRTPEGFGRWIDNNWEERTIKLV